MSDIYMWLRDANPEAVIIEGFEEAYVGMGHTYGGECFAVYDYDTSVRLLVVRHGATVTEAAACLDHEMLGADHGPNPPVLLSRVHVDPDELAADPRCVYDSLAAVSGSMHLHI